MRRLDFGKMMKIGKYSENLKKLQSAKVYYKPPRRYSGRISHGGGGGRNLKRVPRPGLRPTSLRAARTIHKLPPIPVDLFFMLKRQPGPVATKPQERSYRTTGINLPVKIWELASASR
jgi:hypothetical protein